MSKSASNYQWYLQGFPNTADSSKLKKNQELYIKKDTYVAEEGYKCEAAFSPDYNTAMLWEAREGIKDTWKAKDKEIQFSS